MEASDNVNNPRKHGAFATIDKAFETSPARIKENAVTEDAFAENEEDFESLKEKGSELSVHSGSPYTIKELQKELNSMGYTDGRGEKLEEDGIYGINTFNSVIKFQEDNGLFPDGVVGDKTWKAISDKKREKDNEAKEPSSENFSQSIYEDALYNSFPKEVKFPYPSENETSFTEEEQAEFNYADEEFNLFKPPVYETVALDLPSGKVPLKNLSTKVDEISDFDLDAAEIAQHIYNNDENSSDDDKEVSIWELLHCFRGREGLKLGVYIKKDDNPYDPSEYIVAYEGSKEWIDWENNFEQVSGPDSRDMKEAIAYAKIFKNYAGDKKVTFVGHSKGGAEAIAAATATNCDAVVFNPAWANLEDYGVSSENYTGNIKAYIVENEILHDVQKYVNENVDVTFLPDQNEWAHLLKFIPKTPSNLIDVLKVAAILYGGYKNHKIESAIGALKEVK